MKYSFDEATGRSHDRTTKYGERMKELGREGVIPLWMADMNFRTAEPIIGALKEGAEEGIWGYTPRPNSYFKAIRGWQKQRDGWDVKREVMSWSLGVVPALSSIVELFSELGDSIMIQTPVYSGFYGVAKAWGRNVLKNWLVERDDAWGINFEDFEAKAKGARIFLLCSLHNPLGIVWSREEVTRVADICIANNTLLVSDEVHSDLVFHGEKHIPTATLSVEMAGKVASCISGTKTFNLAGLQVSATISPSLEMKKKFDNLWIAMDIHRNNAFSSVVMEAAFNEGEKWLEQLLVYLDENFTFIKEHCSTNIPKIKPTIPNTTYLVWLDCRGLNIDNETLRTFIIEGTDLGLNEGYTFGRSLSGCMRLNVACSRSVLERVLGRLKNVVDRLQTRLRQRRKRK